MRGRVALDDEQLIELLIDVGRINAQAGENGVLQQLLNLISPGGQKDEQRREQQEARQQMQQRLVGESVSDGHDDARDKKREGHAQQQGVQVSALGEKRREDAVERGHDE